MAKKGLKRGLEHLFEDNDNSNLFGSDEESRIEMILVSDVSPNPYQPRKTFDEEKILELSKSIKENGVLQPVLVRKNIIGYEIISGERRLRASKKIGLLEIPAIVYEYDDTQMMEVAIIENIQREDLSILEEANSYKKLISELGYTQEQLATRLGISRSHVANLVRITNLEKEILDKLASKDISLGHAKVLAGIEDGEIRENILRQILKNKLNVRQTEQLIKDFSQEKGEVKKQVSKRKTSSRFYKIEELMIDKLSTKVEITGDNAGLIKISYSGEEDLGRLLELLNMIEE